MNNIIKKGLISSIALMSLGMMVSCDDTLDEVIFSELTPDNAFVTKADAIAAVNGMYDPLISVTNRSIFYLNDMPTDACYMKEMPTELWNERQMDNNQDVTASWRGYYRIISRANIVLDKIPEIELLEFDDDAAKAAIIRDELLAEAHFMRAFAYYQITDIFYSVPLVISSSTPTDAILPPTPMEEIEKQIEEDLIAAKAALPKSFTDKTDAGRATIGAAAGYLCRLQMRIAGRMRVAGKDAGTQWNQALVYANEVLALEGENIYSLQEHVWDIFDPSNDQSKYNNELIFSVRSNPNGGGGTSDIGMNFSPWSYDCGWNLFGVPLSLVWKYDTSDERYTKLLIADYADVYNQPQKRQVLYKMPESIERVGTVYLENKGATDSPDDDVITNEMESSFTQKYKYEHPLTYNYKTGNNMPLMRLADIILCKAEILNEIGGPTQEVVDLLNRLRERAFQNEDHNYELADYSTKEAMRNLICDERLLELNNEGVRRPDLIRMGLWKERMNGYVAQIKLMSEWREKNAAAKADQDEPDKAPHKFDYSADWKVYPSDLTDTDIRRYYPAPKREMDLNPDLKNCRNF